MKILTILLSMAILGCSPSIQQNADGSIDAKANGMLHTGQIIFVEKNGHTFAVFMNDHGAAAMVEVQPK